jgi:hypothetical protein
VHVSELIPHSENDDDTYHLLPDEMYWVSDSISTHENSGAPDPNMKSSSSHSGAGSEDSWEFKVHGSEQEKSQLLTILNKYRDIVSSKLRGKPASVTPMKIEVDYDKYKADRRSREPTQAQSTARKMAIAQWIRQAIADGVIKPSVAPAWAQLMLTKKPNGTWRFAVDYRALNLHTKAMRAPIPNIKKLLHQIGDKRPGIFAKMDFTSGFYQTPVEPGDMKYTAFDTDEGLYEFCVASMGLLNSPWYFQRIMETEVFPHLLHKIMSIYVDDILTWARDINELCDNLEQIFQAIRSKGLTLNPSKCEFGMVCEIRS